MQENRIRVQLLNNNRLLQESVKRLFDLSPDIRLVGAGGTIEAAARDIRRNSPDILLWSYNIAEADHWSTLREIQARFPRVKVLMFDMPDNEDEFIAAMHEGAEGYLLRDASTDDLKEAVRALCRDEAVIPRKLSLSLVEFVSGQRTYPVRSSQGEAAGLTNREHQLVPLITARFTNKQIASRLGISEQTVKNHLRQILHKLNVKHRSEIAQRWAHDNLEPNLPPVLSMNSWHD